MLPSQLPDLGQRAVAVDTETSGLFVDDGATLSVVSLAWVGDDDQIVSVAFPFDQGLRDKVTQGQLEFAPDPNLPHYEWLRLLEWLGCRRTVFQNAKFDLHHLRNGTRHWEGVDLEYTVVWDTMLANKELDPLFATGLKPTGERLALTDGGEREPEQRVQQALVEVQRRYRMGKRYDLLAWEIMEPYAAMDTELTMRLYLLQLERFDRGEASWELMAREMEMTKVLYRIESRGMGFDSGACLQAAGQLMQVRDEAAKLLPFAPPSIPRAKKYFFGDEKRNRPGVCLPYEVTEKGEPQLNVKILRKMVKDQVPNAEQYQTWRKLDTALSMWYQAYPEAVGSDGRLRCSFRQTKEIEAKTGSGGVISGRFSVERVQLHSIPHRSKLDGIPNGIPTPRQFFGPAEGNAMWELDLAQAELRVAAKMAKCIKMLEMIEQGRDAHGETATALFKVKPGDPDWFEYRQVSKRGNFSFIFGVGPDTFQQDLYAQTGISITKGESERIVEDWRALYPEFGRAIWRWSQMAERNGYVTLTNGRKRWFSIGEQTHKAFNQAVQASLAEFAKEWAIWTERGWPGALVMLIHDSEVLEVPIGAEGEKIVAGVARLGEKLGHHWFDMPWGVDYSEWGEH